MEDVRISDLFEQARRPLLSFEFFPPREHRGFAALERGLRDLRALKPDFVSVTYGAGGSTRTRTLAVARLLRDLGFGPVMPHLTCVGATREELAAVVDEIYRLGFRNLMCLRGDPPQGGGAFRAPEGGFAHASDLVRFVKERHPDICCGVAGYPETHPEAASPEEDIRHLKEKVDAGAAFVTTQLFFENDVYFRFVDRCRQAGITQPILPGLLPAVSLAQVEKIRLLCHASFPEVLRQAMERAGGDTPAAEEEGIRWVVGQVDGLLWRGAPGVHLYILNRARTALAPALRACLSRWRG